MTHLVGWVSKQKWGVRKMLEQAQLEKIKTLQIGNSTYRNALSSSSLLLAKAFNKPLEPCYPKTLCLTDDEKLAASAHILFNQSAGSFVSFLAPLNEWSEEIYLTVEVVISRYPIETILFLMGEPVERIAHKRLAMLASDLEKNVTVLSKKIEHGESHFILGSHDSWTGKTVLSCLDLKG